MKLCLAFVRAIQSIQEENLTYVEKQQKKFQKCSGSVQLTIFVCKIYLIGTIMQGAVLMVDTGFAPSKEFLDSATQQLCDLILFAIRERMPGQDHTDDPRLEPSRLRDAVMEYSRSHWKTLFAMAEPLSQGLDADWVYGRIQDPESVKSMNDEAAEHFRKLPPEGMLELLYPQEKVSDLDDLAATVTHAGLCFSRGDDTPWNEMRDSVDEMENKIAELYDGLTGYAKDRATWAVTDAIRKLEWMRDANIADYGHHPEDDGDVFIISEEPFRIDCWGHPVPLGRQ